MSTGTAPVPFHQPSRIVDSQVQPVRGRRRLWPRPLPHRAKNRWPSRITGKPRSPVPVEEAVLGPFAPQVMVTGQAASPDHLRGHVAPCQGDPEAHGGDS